MELRHLRYFVAVAEEQNFTRAAERSFVAQSALSQQIARLERELGSALFVRGARRIELTEAGNVLLPLARNIIAATDGAKEQLEALAGLRRGQLRVGMLQTNASAIDFVSLLGEYHERYPAIDIHVLNQASTDMMQGVADGFIDLAIVGLTGDEIPEPLSQRLLAIDPLVAVMTNAQAEKLPIRADLASVTAQGTLIHFRAGSGIRRHVEQALLRAGLEVTSSFELDQVDDLVHFASIGLGVTVVPRSLAVRLLKENDNLNRTLQVKELADTEAIHPVSAVWDERRLTASAAAFLELLPAATISK